MEQHDWCSVATREIAPIEPGSSTEDAREVREQSVYKFDLLRSLSGDDEATAEASKLLAERFARALDDLDGGERVEEVLQALNFGSGGDHFYDEALLLDDEIRARCG